MAGVTERMLAIRFAEKDDITAVSRLIASSWRGAYRGILDDGFLDALPDAGWMDFLTKGMTNGAFVCLVAEDGGALLGSAILRSGEISKMPEHGELSSLYVRPGALRQGIGGALLDGALGYMRSRGLAYCALDVLAGNENAIGFYQNRGFVLMDATANTTLGGKEYKCHIMRKAL
jgi:ribosomal protein S18 acetylase RimI-like enzyme